MYVHRIISRVSLESPLGSFLSRARSSASLYLYVPLISSTVLAASSWSVFLTFPSLFGISHDSHVSMFGDGDISSKLFSLAFYHKTDEKQIKNLPRMNEIDLEIRMNYFAGIAGTSDVVGGIGGTGGVGGNSAG